MWILHPRQFPHPFSWKSPCVWLASSGCLMSLGNISEFSALLLVLILRSHRTLGKFPHLSGLQSPRRTMWCPPAQGLVWVWSGSNRLHRKAVLQTHIGAALITRWPDRKEGGEGKRLAVFPKISSELASSVGRMLKKAIFKRVTIFG